MTNIKYGNAELQVPDSWDDLTLGFYETFNSEKPETLRDRVGLIAKVCNVDSELLLKQPAELFNEIMKRLTFLFADNPAVPCPYVKIGQEKYFVSIEDDLTLGEWVDVEEVQKKGENMLSNILAIVCRPAGEEYDYKKSEERRKLFADQPVSKVLGVLAFFLRCKTASEVHTATCSSLVQVYDQLPRSTEIFQSLGGGIKLSQSWRIIKYWGLTVLLRNRLRRYLRSFGINGTKTQQKQRNENLTR